jgi:hypothetical protein
MRNDTMTAASPGRSKQRDRFTALWWTLAMVGGLVLVRAPWLPWVTNALGDNSVSINGFNGLAADNFFPWVATSSDDFGQISSPDDGTVPDLPSLSSISLFSGGTDGNAEGGLLVLTAGATALFMTIWTLGGDLERRRSMTRIIFLLGGLSVIFLLRDLFRTRSQAGPDNPIMVGYGIYTGLAGAAAIMIGAGLLYWSIRVHPQD